MTIEELAQKQADLEARSDNGGEPTYLCIKTPISGDPKGWYIEAIWMHHDGDISLGISRGATFSEAAEKAASLIDPTLSEHIQ